MAMIIASTGNKLDGSFEMASTIDYRASALAITLGSILAAFGTVTLIWPSVIAYYGISIDSPEARIAVRAIIGGGEIAFGLILLFGSRLELSAHQRCALAAVIFSCIGSIRICFAAFEGLDILWGNPLREGVIELLLAIVAGMAAKRGSNDQTTYPR